jgi:hypothetical protein
MIEVHQTLPDVCLFIQYVNTDSTDDDYEC